MAGSQNLRVNDAAESRTRVLEALANTPGVARDIVAFNAGAAIYAARRAETLMAGIELAKQALASGAARAKLDVFIAATQQLKSASCISRHHRDVRHSRHDPGPHGLNNSLSPHALLAVAAGGSGA